MSSLSHYIFCVFLKTENLTYGYSVRFNKLQLQSMGFMIISQGYFKKINRPILFFVFKCLSMSVRLYLELFLVILLSFYFEV